MTTSLFVGRRAAFLGITVLLFLPACGGNDDPFEPTYPERTVRLPDLSRAGSIGGIVRFHGDPPRRRIVRARDAFCRGRTDDRLTEDALVENGRVANVFVHLKTGLENYVFDHAKTPIEIDQKDCRFIPHIAGVRRHQPVTFLNSDATSHNVDTRHSKEKQRIDFAMSTKGSSRTVQFAKDELLLPVVCDFHGHMSMFLHVVDHPYFAITGADGTFEIGDVPPGRYTVEAVHERFGSLAVDVEVAASGSVSVPEEKFTYNRN